MRQGMEMKNEDQLESLHNLWPHLTASQRKWLRFQGEIIYVCMHIVEFLYRADLWLFPPFAFLATYFVAQRRFPEHIMKPYAILSVAFMSATLTLFLIRPPKRQIHWLN